MAFLSSAGRRAARVGAVAALTALAACDLPTPSSPVTSLPLLNGAAIAKGPEGYCVDPRRSRASAGFAVMASCTRLIGAPDAAGRDGFVTLQLGPPGSAAVAGAEEDLARLLTSPRGATLLSPQGAPEAIRVTQLERTTGLVAVQFEDIAAPMVAGLQGEEWRAFLDVGNRLATISVRGHAAQPLTSGEALNLMYRAIEALLEANRRR
ncbi:MAG: dihydroxy-acid dehydratase [Rubellimicrobium sp.]|nr:dihydroxy-acid dehydratase [Rubellimicrobium sp.]